MFTWKRRPPPKFETCGSEVEHWVGGVLVPWVEPGHKSCSHTRERATLFLLNLVTPPVLSPVVKWCVVTILLLARCTSLEFVTDEGSSCS